MASRHFNTLILGTGFAGLCMAIQLQNDGDRDFVLIERGSSVGGTWRDNHYPGAACDVPSHLYSFSFAPNTEWSRKYPTQPELHSYLKQLAEQYGLLPHCQFDSNFLGAEFDAASSLWQVRTSNGSFTTNNLVCGNGGLAEPKLPDVPGVANFKGKTFHSSQWDHSYSLAGKRVAVIGTGASAIQFVPEIADKVGRLDVYQRTPNWIIPRPDRAYSGLEKLAFKALPLTRKLHRSSIYWSHEARVVGIVLNPKLMAIFQKIAERHIAKQVPSPALRAAITPDYTIGCKRILISNQWYPAISRPNVDLLTSGIKEVRANSIIDSQGVEREVDCIIFATGFYATENPIAEHIIGPNGSLADAWAGGEEAYLGTLVKGFPNLYFIVGPNTGLGHSSMVFMIETQVAYIKKLLAHKAASGASTLAVKPAVQDQYNTKLHKQLAGSVWATGCKSWYQHKSGKITALWPSFTFTFWLRARNFAASDYLLNNN